MDFRYRGRGRCEFAAIGKRGFPVEQASLDEFFAELGWPPVNVVKIDAEGSEARVLRGMAGVIERNRDLKVVLELNTAVMTQSGTSLTALIRTLQGLAFTTGYIIERGREVPLDQLLPGSRAVYNLLLSRHPS